MLDCEPYLIRKNSFKYYDTQYFERLTLNKKRSFIQKIKGRISSPCFIHVKRLGYVKSVHLCEINPVEYMYKNDN